MIGPRKQVADHSTTRRGTSISACPYERPWPPTSGYCHNLHFPKGNL